MFQIIVNAIEKVHGIDIAICSIGNNDVKF